MLEYQNNVIVLRSRGLPHQILVALRVWHSTYLPENILRPRFRMTRDESGYELNQPWVSIQHRSSLEDRDSSGADLQCQSFVYHELASSRLRRGWQQPYAGKKNRAPGAIWVATIDLVCA